MTTPPSLPFEVVRLERGASPHSEEDVVAVEEPLEIRVEGHSIAVVMRTPGEDRELAAGFLLSEGIIKVARDVFDITTCVVPGNAGKGNVVDVGLARPESFDPAKFSRHVFTSSSCGICGVATIERVLRRRPRLNDEWEIDATTLLGLPPKLARRQETFRTTGGLHACALFDQQGRFVALREDVGRHNAMDKLIGWALLERRTPLLRHLVLLSGRASFEMVQKSYVAGVSMVAAISAPSSLAVEFARKSGQTLSGFVRSRSMNIYAGAERIAFPLESGNLSE